MKAYAVVLGLIATASALPQQQQQQPSPNHGALEVGKTYAVSSDWMIRELPQPRLCKYRFVPMLASSSLPTNTAPRVQLKA